MEIKNIKIPELGKKTFRVLTSNKNIRKMNLFQLEMAKIADQQAQAEDDMVANLEANIKGIDTVLDFLKEVLDLTDEQVEVLDGLEMSRTQELANYLSARLMGLNDKQIEEISASGEADPKE